MTSPTIRAFHAHDARQICNRDGTQSTQALTVENATKGPAFTAEVDGKVLGCGGVVVLWPGVGACWMVLADDIGKHGLWLCKATIEFLDKATRDLKLHRLEAMALHECVRNQKWLELCGFRREETGIARAYLADKRAAVRFERVEG
jgi:hypothetical protein